VVKEINRRHRPGHRPRTSDKRPRSPPQSLPELTKRWELRHHAGLGEVEVSGPVRQQHRLDTVVGKVAHQLDEESADSAASLRLEDLVIESDTNRATHRSIITTTDPEAAAGRRHTRATAGPPCALPWSNLAAIDILDLPKIDPLR
jgi:hypothetical protein